LQKSIFATVNDGWDRDFTAWAEANLTKEITDQIKAEPITRNKWDMLKKNLPTGAATDEKLKAVRAEITTLHDNLKAKDQELINFKAQSANQLNSFQKDYMLSQEIARLDISDQAKQFLTLKQVQDQFIEKIKPKGIDLVLENNVLIPRIKNAEGVMLDLYEGNAKVSLSGLLAKELDNVLKKSNGGGNPNPEPKPIPTAPAPAGLTIAQMNAIEVKKKFEALRAAALAK
jgi:hypothetical protein